MIEQNTRESAVRREEFHRRLKQWLDDSFDQVVGEPSHSGTAWLWVRHGGDHFYLDARSDRGGVREYMRVVEQSAGNPKWDCVKSPDAGRERVAVGPAGSIIEGFDFYRHLPER